MVVYTYGYTGEHLMCTLVMGSWLYINGVEIKIKCRVDDLSCFVATISYIYLFAYIMYYFYNVIYGIHTRKGWHSQDIPSLKLSSAYPSVLHTMKHVQYTVIYHCFAVYQSD